MFSYHSRINILKVFKPIIDSPKIFSGLRPLNTRRPETPREEQRKLFGEQSIRDPTNRPPSAFRYVKGKA